MKKFAFTALFVTVCACRPVGARPSEPRNPFVKISYERALPAVVRRQIPPGGQSRFFGKTGLKFKGQDIYIHVYDLKKVDSSSQRASYGVKDYAPNERAFQAGPLSTGAGPVGPTFYGVQSIALDVFTRRPRAKSLLRLGSAHFNYVRYVNTSYPDSETVGVSWTWLHPGRKAGQLFNVDFRQQGVSGAVGTNMLVVFPHGWPGRPATEGFAYGVDNSSDSNSWGWDISGVDKKGFLAIRSFHSTSPPAVRYKGSTLEWDGRRFAVTETIVE